MENRPTVSEARLNINIQPDGIAVTLYIFILGVHGSNLERDTGYPD
jgi:hypothetical protein